MLLFPFVYLVSTRVLISGGRDGGGCGRHGGHLGVVTHVDHPAYREVQAGVFPASLTHVQTQL